MKIPRVITLDFETEAIEDRPNYPPMPVGLAVKFPGQKSRYLAWGHPSGNNSSKAAAAEVLQRAWDAREPLLFHNAAFDLAVAQRFFSMPVLPWAQVHDTMFLLFLRDPHATTLSLKPSAERILGLLPEEQDAVRAWLVTAGVVRSSDRKWGAHIAAAPGNVVGPYAIGDVDRTEALFRLVYPEIVTRGMSSAYDRERRLLPILMRNEEEGIRLDVKRLRADLAAATAAQEVAEAWLRKRLRTKDLNFDADEEVAEVLSSQGIVTDWTLTKTGKRSTSKQNLTAAQFSDPRIAAALGYRNRLVTCRGTFMEPWLQRVVGTYLQTTWNQVRNSDDRGGFSGTRTGRPSTERPNFLNIPKTFDDKNDGYLHPEFLKVPPLPLMRKYLLPDAGGAFCHRDFSQQELRILAHFEDAELLQAYNSDPSLDVHDYVRDQIKDIAGLDLPRRATKIINFGLIYGMGIGKLALGLEVSAEEARTIKTAQMQSIPGFKALQDAIKATVAGGEPIVTWGGREYYPEPPKIIDGRLRDFGYKLLNYLIQGSAADFTKEAVIRYDEMRVHGRFLVTVYDEINISAPRAHVREEMEILRHAMDDLPLDVPMRSDGKVGPTWGDLKSYGEKR